MIVVPLFFNTKLNRFLLLGIFLSRGNEPSNGLIYLPAKLVSIKIWDWVMIPLAFSMQEEGR